MKSGVNRENEHDATRDENRGLCLYLHGHAYCLGLGSNQSWGNFLVKKKIKIEGFGRGEICGRAVDEWIW